MSAQHGSEPVTLALRVAYPPTNKMPPHDPLYPWYPGRASRRPDVMLLTVEVDDGQELLVGWWRRLRWGHTMAEGLIVPDDVTDDAVAQIVAWATGRPSRGRFARGASRLSVDPFSVWAEAVLRPAIVASAADDDRPVAGKAWIFAWDVPWVASRLCRYWGYATEDFYGGWSLGMFDAPDAPGEGTGYPRLRVRQLRDGMASIRWGGTPSNEKGERPHRLPAVIDLRHLTGALAGPGINTLDAACTEFEVTGPTRDGPVLDRLASSIDAVHHLHRALLRELDVWNAG